MKPFRFAVGIVAMLAVGCAGEGEDGEPEESTTSDALSSASFPVPRTFAVPKKGLHVKVDASPDLKCKLLVSTREYDFPAGAVDPVVSATGKTMCFALGEDTHCHVSGTGTGFCSDTLNNVVHAVSTPATLDGDFVSAFIAGHSSLRANISGHSQGAYDAARAAPLLRRGDQLTLLQPSAATVAPNEALTGASVRGVRVYVAWSANDSASLGIRTRAGKVPLMTFPAQHGIRVHNAPNARDLFLGWFKVPAGRSVSPALDASILSNPGSPRGSWRFPAWPPES